MWITKLLPQNKYGGDGVSNFNLILISFAKILTKNFNSVFNIVKKKTHTEIKFLVTILANEMKTVVYLPRPNFQVYDNPR